MKVVLCLNKDERKELGKIAKEKAFNLYSLKAMMDSSEVGGAPLLGVRGAVIKAHGSSDAKAIKNAVKQAIIYTEKGVTEKISQNLIKE